MLIIEGPDMVGKTTLCKKLAKLIKKEYGASVSHCNVTHIGRESKDLTVNEYMELCMPYTIYDRFHMSELVYGNTTREEEGPKISPEGYRAIDGAIRAEGGMVVVLFAEAGFYTELADGKWDKNDQEQMFDRQTNMQINTTFTMVAGSKQFIVGPGADNHWFVNVDDWHCVMREGSAVSGTGQVSHGNGDPIWAGNSFIERVAAKYASLQKAAGY